MTSKLSPFLLILIIFPSLSYCQFRKYSNEFLNIGAGARGLAMGGSQVASVNDGTAGYWNPAGLVGVKDHPEIDLMHAEYFAGIGKYDFGSIALPIQNNKRTIGVSILRFAVDDIPNTLFLVQPDGSIDYGSITSFSSADYAMLFSFAQNGSSRIRAAREAARAIFVPSLLLRQHRFWTGRCSGPEIGRAHV